MLQVEVASRSQPQASEATPSYGMPESSVAAKSTLTTATGELFEDIDLSDPGTLSKLRDLGRGEEWLLDSSEVTIHEDEKLVVVVVKVLLCLYPWQVIGFMGGLLYYIIEGRSHLGHLGSRWV